MTLNEPNAAKAFEAIALLTEQIKAAAGIAHSAEEAAEQALDVAQYMQAQLNDLAARVKAVETLYNRTDVAPSRAPLPVAVDNADVDGHEVQAIMGAIGVAGQVEHGEGMPDGLIVKDAPSA